jgi:hypothetical protein
VNALSLHPTTTTLAARPSTPSEPAARLRANGVTTVALTRLIAAAVTSCVLLVALVTRLALTSQARGSLHYTFPGVPARLNSAVWIFTNNSRELLGVLGLLLIAQIAARRNDGPTRAQRLVRAGGELVLAGAITANVLVVGAAVGAYGERMIRAMLPHGLFEVSAYSLALALYLQGRRRPLPALRLAGTIAASVALLALAALLETFG